MFRVAKLTPIVDLESTLNWLLVNRESKLVFPTPVSPTRTTTTIIHVKETKHKSLWFYTVMYTACELSLFVCKVYLRLKLTFEHKVVVWLIGHIQPVISVAQTVGC